MAKRDLFAGSKPDVTVNRNGFDNGSRDCFSFPVGPVLPIKCWETVPTDYFEIDVNHIIRSLPMAAATFSRVRAHFDFWFVPYTQIWQNFTPLYTTRTDRQRSNLKGSSFVPTFNLKDLKVRACKDIVQNGRGDVNTNMMGLDVHSYRIAPNVLRLCDLLGYGSCPGYGEYLAHNSSDWPDSRIEGSFANYRINVFRIAAYQKIWATGYRDSVHDTAEYDKLYNFDDVDCTTEANSHIESYRTQAELDKMFEIRYRQYKRDMFTGQYPSAQFGVVAPVPVNNTISGSATLSGLTGTDEHRWSTPSTGSNIYPDPSELDDLFNGANVGAYKQSGDAGGSLSARLLNGDHDFTGQIRGIHHNHEVSGSATITAGATGSIASIYDIYKAQALQTWRERLMRAGNRYKDGYRAIFGVVPKFLEDDYPLLVDSFSCSIGVDDLTQTVPTEGRALGTLGGNGISTNQSQTIKFHTKDYGVLMCMFSLLPEMDYNATGIDKEVFNYKQEDFVIPLYENLGMVPVTFKELDAGSILTPGAQYANVVTGYLPRYYEKKTAVDKVHGLFQYLKFQAGAGGSYHQYAGALSMFATPRDHMLGVETGTPGLFPVGFEYVNPNVCDTMFNVHSDGSEYTDRFFGAIKFNVKTVRPLSVLGVHQV